MRNCSAVASRLRIFRFIHFEANVLDMNPVRLKDNAISMFRGPDMRRSMVPVAIFRFLPRDSHQEFCLNCIGATGVQELDGITTLNATENQNSERIHWSSVGKQAAKEFAAELDRSIKTIKHNLVGLRSLGCPTDALTSLHSPNQTK
jgi:hypothetical protein